MIMIHSLFSRFSVTRPNIDSIRWLIFSLFGTVFLLELFTSAEYVFSYLYVGPILLANLRCDRQFAVRLTVAAALMTLVNLWIPGSHIVTTFTIANRFIAVFALTVTATLAYRNRCYEEAIAQQTARLQFQEQLANLREDFVSTLTHDLKTPLLGAIETLRAFQLHQFGPITDTQQKVIATMIRSHQASLHLVETVLDIYRNDVEGVRLEQQPVDLNGLVEQVVDSLSTLAASYQVSMQLHRQQSTTQDCWINGDALQLQRVLSNLLINAINHSPIGGTVEISLDVQHHATTMQPTIRVLDEGPGIHTTELPQLFERFYQGRSDRQAKGAGLGLYLSRQIVEAHGGTIWAENRAGRGALFGIRFPTCDL